MKDVGYEVSISKQFFQMLLNQLSEFLFWGSSEFFTGYLSVHSSQLKLSSIRLNRIKKNRKNSHFINPIKEEEYDS